MTDRRAQFNSSWMRALRLLCCSTLACAGMAAADVVHLADGRKVEGETRWSADGSQLVITTKLGGLTVSKADVVRIEKAETAKEQFTRRHAVLVEGDHPAAVALARFALRNDLKSESAGILVRVVDSTAPPEVKETAAAMLSVLDYHLEAGVWLAPEDYYPRKGFVKKGARWITAEEARQQRADDAAERAAEDAAKKDRADKRRLERELDRAKDDLARATRQVRQIQITIAKIDGELAAANGQLQTAQREAADSERRVLVAKDNYQEFLGSPWNNGTPQAAQRDAQLSAQVAQAERDAKKKTQRLRELEAYIAEITSAQAQGPTRLEAAMRDESALSARVSELQVALAGTPLPAPAAPPAPPAPGRGDPRRDTAGVPRVYLGLVGDHWLKEKIDQGRHLLLEDGSLWEVEPTDRLTARFWLTTDRIRVVEAKDGYGEFGYRIFNLGDDGSILVRLLSSR